MNIPKSIGLVDFSHMLVVNYKSMGKSQGPNDAENQTMVQLAEVRKSVDHVIMALDSKPYKRSEIYPEYKAQREREPELVQMWKRCVERLTLDGYQTARAPGAEADDVICTLAREYADEGCTDIRIYGTDKDCLACVRGTTVRCFSYQGNGLWEIRDEAWVIGKWEVAPKDMALLLAITGDASDNIPGIAGLGQKTAAKLINAYRNPTGIAVALMAAQEAAKITGKLPAFWSRYASGMASLPRWIKLTTLDDRAPLELHPLKYLERLPVQKLVDDGEMSDADDSGFGPEDFPGDEYAANGPTAAELEEERRVMAASLPVDPPRKAGTKGTPEGGLTREEWDEVDPPKPWVAPAPPPAPEQIKPRIGKDPSADKVMADALLERQRLAAANTNAPKTPERVTETAARIATGNAAETQRTAALLASSGRGGPADKERAFKPNATLSDGGKALHEGKGPIEDLYDRYGQLRPDPTVMDPPRPKVADGSPVESNGGAAIPPPAPAEVVPPTRGPKKLDEIDSAELAVRPAPPSWALALQPATAREALQIAATFFNSRHYSQYGSEKGVFSAIMLGRELGLGAVASLQGLHIINSRPFLSANLMRALAERHEDCEWIMVVSADSEKAVAKTKHRKAGELEYVYTRERAEQAGYFTGGNKQNWIQKTQEMLEARCISKAVRRWYPSSVLGMHAVEEANDD